LCWRVFLLSLPNHRSSPDLAQGDFGIKEHPWRNFATGRIDAENKAGRGPPR
jgi:hypothetical protein